MKDGGEVWRISYPAHGDLDYGNSPRATPLILDDRVVLLGAFGNLTVAELSTGRIVWQTGFQEQFGAEPPIWGFCGSPIAIRHNTDQRPATMIVVQPGTADASLVAFDLSSGAIVWKSNGKEPGYSSFVLAEFGGKQQLIGYDKTTLGGWDVQGNRIWTMKPEIEGDFNVPTPIVIEDHLFVATENNAARLFDFDSKGIINPTPIHKFADLIPDTHSPVVVGNLICGISNGLYCLQKVNLNPVHEKSGDAFDEYTSIISDGIGRILVTSLAGELLLLEIDDKKCEITDELRITDEDEILAHPAIVDDQFIARLGRKLVCLPLGN